MSAHRAHVDMIGRGLGRAERLGLIAHWSHVPDRDAWQVIDALGLAHTLNGDQAAAFLAGLASARHALTRAPVGEAGPAPDGGGG